MRIANLNAPSVQVALVDRRKNFDAQFKRNVHANGFAAAVFAYHAYVQPAVSFSGLRRLCNRRQGRESEERKESECRERTFAYTVNAIDLHRYILLRGCCC